MSWSWYSQKQPPLRKGQELLTFLVAQWAVSQSVSVEHLLRCQTGRSSICPPGEVWSLTHCCWLPSLLLSHSLSCLLCLQINQLAFKTLSQALVCEKHKPRHSLRRNMSNISENTERIAELGIRGRSVHICTTTHTLVGAQSSFGLAHHCICSTQESACILLSKM